MSFSVFPWLDIPFKTIIKPTSDWLRVVVGMLDIPFKTIIKPTYSN